MPAQLLQNYPQTTQLLGGRNRVVAKYQGDPEITLGTAGLLSTTLKSIETEPAPRGTYLIYTLTYDNEPAQATISRPWADNMNGTPYYELNDTGIMKNLPQRSGYFTRWDHDLIISVTNLSGSTTPTDAQVKTRAESLWVNATTTALTDAATDKYIKWVREGWQSPDSEGKIWHHHTFTYEGVTGSTTRTKPGVESFLRPAPVVTAIAFYASENDANFDKGFWTSKRSTPGKTFGISGGEWLITSVRVYPDGVRWARRVDYTWASSWDHDLYEAL